MYGCENWTIKKAECWRIDAFELWCWRRLLRVPWTTRRSNQFILKEISPEYSLEGLMLKLKLQYFSLVMLRANSKKTLMLGRLRAGGEGDDRGWDGWMVSLTWWTWVGASSRRVGNRQGSLACCSPWGGKELHMTERLNWNGLNNLACISLKTRKIFLINIRILVYTKEENQLWLGNRLLVAGSISFLAWDGSYTSVFFIITIKVTNTYLAVFCTYIDCNHRIYSVNFLKWRKVLLVIVLEEQV